MPMSNIFRFMEKSQDEKVAKGCYVYGWICEDWNYVFFYVGKGQGNRYKAIKRGFAFNAIFANNNCFPVILKAGMTEKEAEEWEIKIKQDFTFDKGFPIMDGEKALRCRSMRFGKEIARSKGVRVDGRPEIVIPADVLKNFLQKQKDGELTVNECCRSLGISRSKWYNSIREVS